MPPVLEKVKVRVVQDPSSKFSDFSRFQTPEDFDDFLFAFRQNVVQCC